MRMRMQSGYERVIEVIHQCIFRCDIFRIFASMERSPALYQQRPSLSKREKTYPLPFLSSYLSTVVLCSNDLFVNLLPGV